VSVPESGSAEVAPHEPIFRLIEYALAERGFIGTTLDALARVHNPLLSRIPTERTSRVQTTQITTDTGDVVEQQPLEIRTKLTQTPQDIVDGRLDNFLASLDEAAEEYAHQFGKQFYEYLSRVTEAIGNVVDAKDRPFFDSFYEMLEKIDLRFDEEGRVQQGWELHVNPANAEKLVKDLDNMTPDQHAKLDALIERKRQEFNARRRNRRIPRGGN
jgi:hypothetical protein